MKKIYKEPLLHFLIIGALIFVLFSIVNKEEDIVSGNKIVVSTAEIKRLSDNWSGKWNRLPTETELKGLVESYIKEEVYYREALALGLDQDDTIISAAGIMLAMMLVIKQPALAQMTCCSLWTRTRSPLS